METVANIIAAINAYAENQKQEPDDRSYLSLVHASNRSPEADAARALREAGRDALDLIQDWPTLEQRTDGACVLQAPDGTRIVYYCERLNHRQRTLERVQLMPDNE